MFSLERSVAEIWSVRHAEGDLIQRLYFSIMFWLLPKRECNVQTFSRAEKLLGKGMEAIKV